MRPGSEAPFSAAILSAPLVLCGPMSLKCAGGGVLGGVFVQFWREAQGYRLAVWTSSTGRKARAIIFVRARGVCGSLAGVVCCFYVFHQRPSAANAQCISLKTSPLMTQWHLHFNGGPCDRFMHSRFVKSCVVYTWLNFINLLLVWWWETLVLTI